MANTHTLMVKMAYNIYYTIDFSRSIDERTREKVERYVERCILNSMQRVYDVSNEFLSLSRFYNVKTDICIVKRKSKEAKLHYENCGITVIGDRAEIELSYIINKMNTHKQLDFTRFIIDDILNKTGFFLEDIGRFAFIGSTNIIRHHLLYSLHMNDCVEPDKNEYIALCLAFPNIDLFIKEYVYSEVEEIKKAFDNRFGSGMFDSVVEEQDKQRLLNLLDKLFEEHKGKLIRFARSLGYSIKER